MKLVSLILFVCIGACYTLPTPQKQLFLPQFPLEIINQIIQSLDNLYNGNQTNLPILMPGPVILPQNFTFNSDPKIANELQDLYAALVSLLGSHFNDFLSGVLAHESTQQLLSLFGGLGKRSINININGSNIGSTLSSFWNNLLQNFLNNLLNNNNNTTTNANNTTTDANNGKNFNINPFEIVNAVENFLDNLSQTPQFPLIQQFLQNLFNQQGDSKNFNINPFEILNALGNFLDNLSQTPQFPLIQQVLQSLFNQQGDEKIPLQPLIDNLTSAANDIFNQFLSNIVSNESTQQLLNILNGFGIGLGQFGVGKRGLTNLVEEVYQMVQSFLPEWLKKIADIVIRMIKFFV